MKKSDIFWSKIIIGVFVFALVGTCFFKSYKGRKWAERSSFSFSFSFFDPMKKDAKKLVEQAIDCQKAWEVLKSKSSTQEEKDYAGEVIEKYNDFYWQLSIKYLNKKEKFQDVLAKEMRRQKYNWDTLPDPFQETLDELNKLKENFKKMEELFNRF